MVGGVAGGVGDLEAEHLLPARERLEIGLWDWSDLAPEPLHLIAVETLGARQQLLGIGQVSRPLLVDVDRQLGPPSDEIARRACVVEVDVGEQQRPRHLAVEGLDQVLHGARWPGIDQHPVELPAADHPLSAEMPDVDEPHPGMTREACAARAPAAVPRAEPSVRMTSAAARFPDCTAPSK